MSKTFLVQNSDIVYSSGRRPQMIADGPKVRQDLLEMLSVNTLPDGFGAGIFQLLGQSPQLSGGDYQNIEFSIRDKLTSGTNRFVSLQKQSVTNRPSTELIASILNLQVAQSTDDPTTYFWRIDWSTYDGQNRSLQGAVNT
jgi:hypothetical protein